MGQKSNPIVLRLGINKTWASNWYADADYATFLHQDILIRKLINKKHANAGISRIDIERPNEVVKVTISAARPGLLIGKKGEDLGKLKQILKEKLKRECELNIKEVRKVDTDAQLIAQNIAQQIERRVAFRRVIKKAMQNAMRFSLGGCKIMVAGRLNGAEIARTEWIREGRVPLHTLKADIDYATYEALTVYGLIGIKVWVFKTPQEGSKLKKPLVPARKPN